MITALLEKYKIKPERSRGQFFLKDIDILRYEADVANVSSNDVVLEIGAGLGTLTKILCKRAKKVYAVEGSKVMLRVLRRELAAYRNVEIIEKDFRRLKLPDFNKCVSNIPYGLSKDIVERLAEFQKYSVITFQKEYADKITAKPFTKQYKSISVISQTFFNINYLGLIEKKRFYPTAPVDSALLELIPKKRKGDLKKEEYIKFVKSIFKYRNKNLKNAIEASGRLYTGEYENKKVIGLDTSALLEVFKSVEGK